MPLTSARRERKKRGGSSELRAQREIFSGEMAVGKRGIFWV